MLERYIASRKCCTWYPVHARGMLEVIGGLGSGLEVDNMGSLAVKASLEDESQAKVVQISSSLL